MADNIFLDDLQIETCEIWILFLYVNTDGEYCGLFIYVIFIEVYSVWLVLIVCFHATVASSIWGNRHTSYITRAGKFFRVAVANGISDFQLINYFWEYRHLYSLLIKRIHCLGKSIASIQIWFTHLCRRDSLRNSALITFVSSIEILAPQSSIHRNTFITFLLGFIAPSEHGHILYRNRSIFFCEDVDIFNACRVMTYFGAFYSLVNFISCSSLLWVTWTAFSFASLHFL